jgi:hypothetical protein
MERRTAERRIGSRPVEHDRRTGERRGRRREMVDPVRVSVRFEPAEYDLIDAGAKSLGLSNPVYVRRLVISALQNRAPASRLLP